MAIKVQMFFPCGSYYLGNECCPFVSAVGATPLETGDCGKAGCKVVFFTLS